MSWDHNHILHIRSEPETPDNPETHTAALRKRIEPWLSALFQAEHLSLLLGNGFTSGIANCAGADAVGMTGTGFGGLADENKVEAYAAEMAEKMGRGEANIEDKLSAALSLHAGMRILKSPDAPKWEAAIETVLSGLIKDVVAAERGICDGMDASPAKGGPLAREILISFLMSFASRAASRERLHIFTTNYDRLIEKGCDLAGLRIVDRFVGALEPEFRSSRLQVDMHYTPPGVRGEPRHLEGVAHLTKLHGSLDWRYEKPRLFRTGLPFGADGTHPAVQTIPGQSVMIYPNAIKDVETGMYPYADLFRDFSSMICQPNNVLVTYGYGFGDDHVNRIITDMLTIPSTHLVIMAWGDKPHERVASFVESIGRTQQLSLLLGKHFGDIRQLVQHYLPRPAIDPLMIRMSELMDRRNKMDPKVAGEDSASPAQVTKEDGAAS